MPHWLLFIYSFQFRSAFRASASRHRHCVRHRHILELISGVHSGSDVKYIITYLYAVCEKMEPLYSCL